MLFTDGLWYVVLKGGGELLFTDTLTAAQVQCRIFTFEFVMGTEQGLSVW